MPNKCYYCNKWFKNMQAIKGHLKGCVARKAAYNPWEETDGMYEQKVWMCVKCSKVHVTGDIPPRRCACGHDMFKKKAIPINRREDLVKIKLGMGQLDEQSARLAAIEERLDLIEEINESE